MTTDKQWRPHNLHDLTQEEVYRLAKMKPVERDKLIRDMNLEEFMSNPANIWAVKKMWGRIRLREWLGLTTNGLQAFLVFERYLAKALERFRRG